MRLDCSCCCRAAATSASHRAQYSLLKSSCRSSAPEIESGTLTMPVELILLLVIAIYCCRSQVWYVEAIFLALTLGRDHLDCLAAKSSALALFTWVVDQRNIPRKAHIWYAVRRNDMHSTVGFLSCSERICPQLHLFHGPHEIVFYKLSASRSRRAPSIDLKKKSIKSVHQLKCCVRLFFCQVTCPLPSAGRHAKQTLLQARADSMLRRALAS